MDRLHRSHRQLLQIVDHDVGRHTFAQPAAITDADGPTQHRREPPVRFFQRHDLLVAHPVGQEVSGIPAQGQELGVRPAIRGADQAQRMLDDRRQRFLIDC